jgi:regulation of enolase protein 1 (concanavalin A-like superfamily)
MRKFLSIVLVLALILSTSLVISMPVKAADNLALGKIVTVSSTQSGYPASNAVDGSTTTRWSADFTGDPQWIYVDLGSSQTVSRVVLKWETAYADQYKIQVSANASTWTDIYSETAGNGGTDDISFTATSARYVRVYGTHRATTYSYSLWEFEVYGSITPTPTPTPTPVPGTYDDEFNSSTLSSQWSWIRQDSAYWSLTAASGYMRITTEWGEFSHSTPDNKNTLIETAPSGDFTITTKLNGKPTANWAQGGLVVYQDDNNFFKMVRLYNNANQFQAGKEVSGTVTSAVVTDSIASTISYLKIVKSGTNYSGYYSSDGSAWTQVWTAQSMSMSNIKIGIIAFNGGSSGGPNNNMDFDYFHLTTSGVTPTPTPTATATATPTPTPPSGFWLSGGSRDTNTQAGTTEWANMRGRACTFQIAYSTRDSGWSTFVSTHGSSGQIAAFTDKSMTYMIQTAPFPSNTSSTYAALVAGSYDSYWQQIGTQLKNKADQGFNIIISIAWEMNGTYMYWGGGSGVSTHYTSPAQYISGYQRIVNQLRVTYPAVQTAWIINAHGTPSAVGTTDAWALYPGDSYATYVGTDNYDMYPPSFTKTAFDATANANGGLYWLANHAAQHGKQVIVGEWGVNNNPGDVAAGNGGGDNANFIQWMYDTFNSWNASGRLKAEYYFADPIGGGNVDSDLIGGNPNSRAKYSSLW